jgi:hypothetical protein
LIWGYDAIATLKPLIQAALPSKHDASRSSARNEDDDQ